MMYVDHQGWYRVQTGQYLILNARGGSLVRRKAWEDMVKEGDHLAMCVALGDLQAREGYCPFRVVNPPGTTPNQELWKGLPEMWPVGSFNSRGFEFRYC